MRTLWKILVILLGINSLGCNAQDQSKDETSAIKEIHSAEAKSLLDNNGDIIILDVRTPREFEAGHIKGAKNINVADPDFRSQIESLPRDSTYLVYCRTGNRSRYPIKLMEEMNFKSVYHLKAGITEWVREGYKVEK